MSDNPLASLQNLKPLDRRPAAEIIAENLLALISSGNLKAGDTLPTEQELGAALQVSRPVIREALRGLQILGVVESRQGGRCYVTDLKASRLASPFQLIVALDEENGSHLYEARVAVEGQLLILGVGRATPTAIEHLEHLVREGYRLTADPVAFRVMDIEFHRTLTGLAGNPFLDRMAQSLYHIGSEFRRMASETPGVLDRSAVEHEQIVKAIKAGDANGAAEAMRIHLESIRRTTLNAMRERETPNRGNRRDPPKPPSTRRAR